MSYDWIPAFAGMTYKISRLFSDFYKNKNCQYCKNNIGDYKTRPKSDFFKNNFIVLCNLKFVTIV